MIVGESVKFKEVVRLADLVAPLEISVLLTGEEGVGRETLARYIHDTSPFKRGPFVTVDVAERPSGLVDAELLGHLRGAFSGASSSSSGFLQSADGGTLFLKNVQDIPFEKQSIFLRFLEEKVVLPIGGSTPVPVHTRVIATATPDLQDRVGRGQFRTDLYYRLNVLPIRIPPLRERTEDIVPLAESFLKEIVAARGTKRLLADAAKHALRVYPWPGNARELRNKLWRAESVSDGPNIDVPALDLEPPQTQPVDANPSSQLQQEAMRLRSELEALSRLTIVASPIWEGRRFAADSNLCFVLMPFADSRDLQRVYADHVKPMVEQAGLRCERADDIHDISGVMQSVWEGINRARIVIADMTDRNPNVFYELGIAHTLGKPVIMITQSMDFVPFDLKHLRCIVYEYKPARISRFEEALRKTLATVLESPELMLAR